MGFDADMAEGTKSVASGVREKTPRQWMLKTEPFKRPNVDA